MNYPLFYYYDEADKIGTHELCLGCNCISIKRDLFDVLVKMYSFSLCVML